MFIKEDYDEWFNLYFKVFKEHAPKEYIEYGGYDTGLPNGTACSLESIISFANKIEPNSTILNCGAGASSWLLRKMFNNVICTDPDEGYLQFISKLCKTYDLPASEDSFILGLKNAPDCDYLYYDYGLAERLDDFPLAMQKTKKMIYVDDTDDRQFTALPGFRKIVYDFADNKGFKVSDCRDATDIYGRFGVVVYTNSL
jgi:hypothetical protein